MSPSLAADMRLYLDPCQVMQRAGLAPDPWQERLMRGRPSRALVVCSRQSGKTTGVAAMALHRALTSNRDVVAVAPSQRQAAELLRRSAAFLGTLGVVPKRLAATMLVLPGGGRILALPGTAASVRGYSPVLAVIDEAAFVAEETYEACRPLLAATGGDLVCLSTPNGERGWFFDAWKHGGDTWHRTLVRWDQCARITCDFIEGERAALSASRFAAEYECSFAASGGGTFDRALIDAAMGTLAAGLPVITPCDWDADDEQEDQT